MSPFRESRGIASRLLFWCAVFAGILFFAFVLGLAIGSETILLSTSAKILVGHLPGFSSTLRGIPDDIQTILWQIRFPRVALAGLVGASLSASGAALQGLLGNPLADPYVIGVSSGAAVGAALVLAFGYGAMLGGMAAPAAAFVTALLAMLLVFALSRRKGRLPTQGFLLAGVVVGSFFWSMVTLILTLSGQDMQSVFFWLMGGFSGADWNRIGVTFALDFVGFAGLLAFAKDLNLMSVGEESAGYLGVNVETAKMAVVSFAALSTAASVAVSGVIGFVGLLVPHIARRIVGADHRILLPVSALLGGAFLILADTAARTAFGSTEMPVGLLTSLLGGPFFFLVLRRQILD